MTRTIEGLTFRIASPSLWELVHDWPGVSILLHFDGDSWKVHYRDFNSDITREFKSRDAGDRRAEFKACSLMALHEQSVGATDEWYTPPHVFHALGCTFDMDVAAPEDRYYLSTPTRYWISEDSLNKHWGGFIWMNPPFGGRNGISPWLEKFFAHGNGIALTPDRTSAPWWQRFARQADSILFVSPKLKFIGADGMPGDSPAQGTCLMASGERAVDALNMAQSKGLGLICIPSGRFA